MVNNIIEKKIQRLAQGYQPRLVDLFSGCGGISLGMKRAGFDIVAAVEFDPDASRSHAINFHGDLDPELFERHSLAKDITKIEPRDLLELLDIEGECPEVVDVIVGGPPCQAFARVGRAKLREIANDPLAYLNDARGSLYLRYLHYVKELQPLAIVMENVPDILNYGGVNVSEQICEELEELGYVCKYTLLNSVFYGVPQTRERMVLVAIHQMLGVSFDFPEPTHWCELPKGYSGTKSSALKLLNLSLFGDSKYRFSLAPVADEGKCKKAVTSEEALGDLPVLTDHLSGKIKRGAKRFLQEVTYPNDHTPQKGTYGFEMRNWEGLEIANGVSDHVIRIHPRDYPIFQKMKPGDQYPQALIAANCIFQERLAELSEAGKISPFDREAVDALRRSIVPPYNGDKFPNKWRKIEPDRPSRTLMAHLGKDTYSHIHYDSKQARTISVREAARLQSFPDGFKFSGTMNPAFRQIGNAVPPLLAFAIGRQLYRALMEKSHEQKFCDKTPHAV